MMLSQPGIVEELTSVVGSEHVLAKAEHVAAYETATFKTEQTIALVVLPANTEEVRQVVRIANRRRMPVYPVSRGRNWGLGSRVPVGDGNVVIDLKRMNRIVELDEQAGYITVEPGVTFQQAADHLRSLGSQNYLAATGGPPDSSLIGNALERGDGVGPLGDKARYCCDLEVVLPTGEVIRTGLGAFEGSLTSSLSPFGLGPAVEGLFFQSNLGIVTRMTFWLARRPVSFQCVILAARDDGELLAMNEAVRELQRVGVIGDTAYSLWNIYRFLTSQGQYPFGPGGVANATPEQLLERLPAPWQGMKWAAFIGVYSPSEEHARASKSMIRRALKGKSSKLMILDGRSAAFAKLVQGPLGRAMRIDLAGFLKTFYYESPFVGHPTKLEQDGAYWRKRNLPRRTYDLDRDGIGLHWVCPSLPFEGRHILRMTKVVEEVAFANGLEPLVMFFNMNQWFLKSFIPIIFDRSMPGEEESARRCHDEIGARLFSEGYTPVRVGIQAMDQVEPLPSYVELVRTLKRALDPADILSPGRYDFRHRWQSSQQSRRTEPHVEEMSRARLR